MTANGNGFDQGGENACQLDEVCPTCGGIHDPRAPSDCLHDPATPHPDERTSHGLSDPPVNPGDRGIPDSPISHGE